MSLESIQWRLKTEPAPGFVSISSADEQPVCVLDEPLRSVRGRSASDTDGQRFGDVFRDCQELRHRVEGFSPKVLVQSGYDDTFSGIS
jgi:hypothetical protein